MKTIYTAKDYNDNNEIFTRFPAWTESYVQFMVVKQWNKKNWHAKEYNLNLIKQSKNVYIQIHFF